MAKVRGTLSTRGWLETPEARLDRMLEEYVLANPSQTLLYHGRIRSLISTLQAIGTDPHMLSEAIKKDLSQKAAINFAERENRVEVTCVTDDDNNVNVEISMTVYENGIPYNLNRVLANASNYAKTTNASVS